MIKLRDNESDYIQPSQLCIKKPSSSSEAKRKSNKFEVEREDDPHLIEKQRVTITLNDCLACSGCITSSEAVLITSQSHHELFSFLLLNNSSLQQQRQISDYPPQSRKKLLVVSISPQSCASFASKYGVECSVAMRRLSFLFRDILSRLSFLSSSGVPLPCRTGSRLLEWAIENHSNDGSSDCLVFDTCLSREIALLSIAKDFIERYRSSNQSDSSSVPALPLLSSACPGWICYAEKTHGSFILPYISSAKSPQQVMGSLVKYYLPQLLASSTSATTTTSDGRSSTSTPLSPSDIYHVSVMPCFDKKLEASRGDFFNDFYNCRDVDLVLSTGEIEMMLGELGLGFDDLPGDCNVRLDSALSLTDHYCTTFYNSATPLQYLSYPRSSGGYLEYVMAYACEELFGCSLNNHDRVSIKEVAGRNLDYMEYVLNVDGEDKLSFVKAFGFRNIQNIVRQVKKSIDTDHQQKHPRISHSKNAFDFVEIMACPSGCINGGGQLRPNGTAKSTSTVLSQSELKAHVGKTEQAYNSIPSPDPQTSNMLRSKVENIYNNWINGGPSNSLRFTHTQYHNVSGKPNLRDTQHADQSQNTQIAQTTLATSIIDW